MFTHPHRNQWLEDWRADRDRRNRAARFDRAIGLALGYALAGAAAFAIAVLAYTL